MSTCRSRARRWSSTRTAGARRAADPLRRERERAGLHRMPAGPVRVPFSQGDEKMNAGRILIAAFVAACGAAFAQAPNDAQIAHIVVTANQVDIDAGKLASTKSTNKEVQAFGKQMVADHSGVNQQATALVTKLKVTPQDNPTSQSLAKGGK